MNTLYVEEEDAFKAKRFSEIYDKKGYGENVLGVSHEEYIDFIRIGKLCELVFKRLLDEEGVSYECKEILIPCPDKHRIGSDFKLTLTGETIDVKAANKSFHIRLLVREDQFRRCVHDVYIGMKYIDNSKVECWGYVLGKELEKVVPKDFGYGPCRYILLKELHPIDKFMERAKEGEKIL